MIAQHIVLVTSEGNNCVHYFNLLWILSNPHSQKDTYRLKYMHSLISFS